MSDYDLTDAEWSWVETCLGDERTAAFGAAIRGYLNDRIVERIVEVRADERAKVLAEEALILPDTVAAEMDIYRDRLRAKAGKLPRRYRKEHGKWLITVDVADLASLLDGEQ